MYDNALFMSQAQMYIGFGGFVLKTTLIHLLISGCPDISGYPNSITAVLSVIRPIHIDL